MDPKHIGDVHRHLEKQKELLSEIKRSLSHELHTLQVEEEVLMRKYYEFMVAQDLIDKKKTGSLISTRDGRKVHGDETNNPTAHQLS